MGFYIQSFGQFLSYQDSFSFFHVEFYYVPHSYEQFCIYIYVLKRHSIRNFYIIAYLKLCKISKIFAGRFT